MENRAHYILIGIASLAVVVALLLFALWLSKIGLSREYHSYRVVFTRAVTGLTNGSPVQYNGINVGEVESLKLDDHDPSKVDAIIQVTGKTPVKTDTWAELAQMGITGGKFVQLTGGSAGSARLLPSKADPVPTIPTRVSGLAALMSSGQTVATRLDGILSQLTKVLSPANVKHINDTLANIDATTAMLATKRKQIGSLITQANTATRRLDATLAQMQHLVSGPVQATLKQSTQAMGALRQSAQRLNQLLADNQGALSASLRGASQIGPTLQRMRATLKHADQIMRKLSADPAGFLLGRDRAVQFTPSH